MTVTINRHIIVSEAEQFAIVNALAFYNDYHTTIEDLDALDQWCSAFVEDNGSDSPTGLVDTLATKIANS